MAQARLADLPQPQVAPHSIAADRNHAVGYLRAFVTLLVLAHHSVIAFMPGMPHSTSFTAPPYMWGAFPVPDPTHTWIGWALLVMSNDMFFMALMFLIAGLFTPASLERKGPAAFLRERLSRLGVPFVVSAGLLSPLAYYPAYLVTGGTGGPAGFVQAWLGLGVWNPGPAWFLGVLMGLAVLAALVQATAPKAIASLARLGVGADRKPGRFLLWLALASAAAYIPMCAIFGPLDWLNLGPFALQGSRVVLYPLYFMVGMGIGAYGLDRGLLAKGGALARRWWTWILVAVPALAAALAVTVAAGISKGQPHALWLGLGGLAFGTTCAAMSMMWMGIFRRFTGRAGRIWDSLSANAYGMYLVHYAIASWVQLAILPADLPGVAKGAFVFALVVALSWVTTAGLRRIPGAARFL